MPKEGEVLAYTPPNIFIPDSPVTPLKADRKNPNFSSNPEMIEFGDSTVFFKQDDSFDQPIVLVNVKIYCNDNNFPQNKKASCFLSLWQNMLEEHLRELKYTARVAIIEFSQ